MSLSIDRLTAALADRYRIERELGQGGMATVYLAEDLKHKRKVALKVLKPELAAVLGAERFVQEITTTAALQHPHILPLFDSGTADGFLFYVMPFIDGETLRSKLDRETQLGVDEAVKITVAIADALDHAHRHGVIHRDIKPENILLHEGRPMVADFGIALAVSAAAGGRMTETGLSLGTPHYMSPEQATAEKEISARSDVYSLASVLYEMLAGQPPHLGGSAQQIIMKIVTEVAQPVTQMRKSVPPNVAAALAKALEKLPADRFETAKAFAEALANPAYTVAGADGAGGRAALGRRRPWPAVAMAAVVFGAGLVVGGLLMSGRDRPSRTPGTFVMASAAVGGISYTQLVNRLAVARDGSRIAYVSADSTGEHVFVRSVADPVARPVAQGYAPFFSPDGASLGYCENGVWTVPIGGGAPTRVYGEGYCASVSWDDDGRIRFTTGRQALLSVSPAGLAPDSLVFHGDTTVFRGELIGSGRLLLSLAVGAATPVIAVREPDGRLRELLEGIDARLAPTDVLLFTRREGNEHVLLSVPFDRRRGMLRGEPRVLERGTAGVTNAGGTASGDLVYLAGSTQSDRQIVVTDFEGNERSHTADGLAWVAVSAAGDGHTLIATSWNGWFRSLWSLDLRTSAVSRLTRGVETFGALPTPDGGELFYIEARSDPRGEIGSWLRRQSLGADAPPTRLSYPGELYPSFVSADGAWLYVSGPSSGGDDISRLRIDGRGDSVERVVATPASENAPQVSPDDRWLAFASGASGTVRTAIVPLSAPTRPIPIGSGPGFPVGWTRNGTLFHYLAQTRELWSVEIGPSGPRPGPGRRRYALPATIRSFSLLPDGEHLVAVRGGPIYQDIIMAQGALAGSAK